ncbi:Fanconi anemia group G protein isoform X2 [Seriola lalandi dorsalis]|uniref:Fanconi anemia group G protein isoform X2 n=1 Tax=Seriola lalandi dorsalis TaxID=1841481 RepID=UPI000C6F9774|nr:Fanconi anemia group G protein isoform X2 [Seriola lalandi dorsalis]XP_056231954.1 Fanconi anemia group G protein isoform X1 [Seriola aureovittata]
MYRPTSLVNKWVQENNELVNKWKQQEGGGVTFSRDQNQSHLRCSSSEFYRLLRKIQGVPPLADHTHLELSVVYNTCVCATAQSQFTEAELLLTQALRRALQITGNDSVTSETPVFWRTVLKSVANTALNSCVLYLLCLQWAIWLATCQLKTIQEFKEELCSLLETLCGGVGDDRRNETWGKSSDVPLLVTDPRKLVELLQICTSIAQGVERLSEGQCSEALSDLQSASALPAPRALVAYVHLLSGSCLAHMSRPQMALQCYRKALETDSCSVCALYQSMLIYRQLGNTQAEIQALRLLHSSLMLPSATVPTVAGAHLLSPSLLLCSQSLRDLLSVPSAPSVLHNLALKCVLHGRVSEGVEHYLDLLAALHSEDQHGVRVKTLTDTQDNLTVHGEATPLPRLPQLYLETGAALLMARRPADCMALCNEVISTTLELLPEKLVLEDPEDRSQAETKEVRAEGEDMVAMLLWTGAAFLLQGHCHTHLTDWKQAVTHYTRCINLLVKVRYKKKGFQPQIPSADMVVKQETDLCTLQRLKGLSLAGRGISFTQTDRLREALRDLLLSLQAFPECVGAGLWCGEVLWRLGRRQEAAACWEKTWSFTTQSSVEGLPLYLQEPQSGPSLDSTELRRRIQELGPT